MVCSGGSMACIRSRTPRSMVNRDVRILYSKQQLTIQNIWIANVINTRKSHYSNSTIQSTTGNNLTRSMAHGYSKPKQPATIVLSLLKDFENHWAPPWNSMVLSFFSFITSSTWYPMHTWASLLEILAWVLFPLLAFDIQKRNNWNLTSFTSLHIINICRKNNFY